MTWGTHHIWQMVLLLSCSQLLAKEARSSLPSTQSSRQELVEEPHLARVRIYKRLTQASLRGHDLEIFEYKGEDHGPILNASDQRQMLSTHQTSYWDMRCANGKVHFHSRFRNLREKLESKGLKPMIPERPPSEAGGITLQAVGAVVLKSRERFIHINGRPFRSELRIYPQQNSCEVINVVDLEKYVEGLINSEFNSQWDEEAVAAQSVVARSYGLYRMKEVRRDLPQARFDLESTVMDQVYDGSLKEDLRARAVVEKTKGMVLVVEKEANPSSDHTPAIRLVKAFYHATCGGETELPQQVWDTHYQALNKRVICDFCKNAPGYQWGLKLNSWELENNFRKQFALLKDLKLQDLQIRNLPENQRVQEVVSTWISADGKTQKKIISAVAFRNLFGTQSIKSTRFQIFRWRSPQGQVVYHFSGKGNGHGVGMCQWGAKTMGERGYNVQQILTHYYPDAKIKKLW